MDIQNIRTQIKDEMSGLFQDVINMNADDFNLVMHFFGHTNSFVLNVYVGGYNKAKPFNEIFQVSSESFFNSVSAWMVVLSDLKDARKKLNDVHSQYRASKK